MRILARKIIFRICCCLVLQQITGTLSGQIQTDGRPNVSELFSDTAAQANKAIPMLNPFDTVEFETADLLTFSDYWYRKQNEHRLLSLGFLGSPTRRIIFHPVQSIGFDLGLYQFADQNIAYGDLNFLDSQSPHILVQYHQGQRQSDGAMHAVFNRKFRDGISVILDYGRINNEGFYQNQNLRNTHIGTSIWYQNKKKNFNLLFSHLANTNQQENNGGLTSDSLPKASFDNLLDIPTFLESSNAQTRYTNRSLRIDAYYLPFAVKSDSTRSKSSDLVVHYQSEYNREIFKYTDENADNAEVYYDQFLTDARGVRNYIRSSIWSNQLDVEFANINRSKRFLVGIQNRLITLDNEVNDESFAELFLHGQLEWLFGDQLELKASSKLKLTNDQEFKLQGYAAYTLSEHLKLSGNLLIIQKNPNFIQRNVWITQEEVWNRNLSNVFTNSLSANLSITNLGLNVRWNQNVISNPIFFDETVRPNQLDRTISISSVSAIHDWQIGLFRFHNHLIWQIQDKDEVFKLPEWYSEHGIYYEGPLFKRAMSVLTGFRLKYHPDSPGMTYFPVIGQFVHSNATTREYLQFDYVFSFTVDRFQTFIRLLNLNDLWNQSIYYPTSRYPFEKFTYRIGIQWLFLN